MQVIAHRGANKEAEENSWAAFSLAIEAGADRLELDIHLSADGHPVVVHDPNLHRTTGIDREVGSLTRAELAEMRLRNGESLPFLDEVLARLLDKIEINIEIKSHHPDIAAVTARIISDNKHSPARIIISSFIPMHLLYLAEHHPELRLACLWADEWEWPRLSFISPLVFMNECRAKILHPVVDYITADLVEQCHRRGWLVYPYAPMIGEEQDREGLWAELMTAGVDGLCTNYPREFRRWLQELETERLQLANYSA